MHTFKSTGILISIRPNSKGHRKIAFKNVTLILAKAIPSLLFFPPHKWDGNEFKYWFRSYIFYSLPFGFSQRIKWAGKTGFSTKLIYIKLKKRFPWYRAATYV